MILRLDFVGAPLEEGVSVSLSEQGEISPSSGVLKLAMVHWCWLLQSQLPNERGVDRDEDGDGDGRQKYGLKHELCATDTHV